MDLKTKALSKPEIKQDYDEADLTKTELPERFDVKPQAVLCLLKKRPIL
ncbi:hypothetical protein [Yersinia frederiksenii]|nr:hypothetical protein [Yersinia frederiksenii]